MTFSRTRIEGKRCPHCSREFPAGDEFVYCPRDGNVLAVLKVDPLIGQILSGDYEVLSHVGSGGWSNVYTARQHSLKRVVALKILHPHLSSAADKVQRFLREAEAAARLKHPSITQIYGSGKLADGAPYTVMEYLEGASLSDLIAVQHKLSLERALHICYQVCDGLQEAHATGLIHRDIKPSNIFIQAHDQVKILDFGLAKGALSDPEQAASLTETGQTLGTPHYMSPEQCMGMHLTPATDIYSLGCVLYEMISGNKVVAGNSSFEAMHQHLKDKPASLAQSGLISVPLETAIFKALEKDCADRYRSAVQMKAALQKAQRRKTNAWEQWLSKNGLILKTVAITLLIGLMALGAYSFYELKRQPLKHVPNTSGLPDELWQQLHDTDPAEHRRRLIESWQGTHPDYNYYVENELRNLWWATDQHKSAEHMNIIFAHSLADNYTTNILSDWQLGHDDKKAVMNLLYWTETYPEYPYLLAACYETVGDLYATKLHNPAKARFYFNKVFQIFKEPKEKMMLRYRNLSGEGLSQLGKSSASGGEVKAAGKSAGVR